MDEELRGGDLAGVEVDVLGGGARVERGLGDLGLAHEQPADDEVTGTEQQAGGVLADLVEVLDVAAGAGVGLEGGAGHVADDALDVLQCLAEGLALGVEVARLRAQVLGELSDLHRQAGHRLPVVADDLAEEEVQTLDRRGAFVEGVDLGVADVLLERVFLQEARAAEGLQRLGAQQHPGALGAEALDDRQEQVAHPRGDVGRRPLLGVDRRDSRSLDIDDILEGRGVDDERTQPLGIRLLQHERTAHVGVVGDGDPRRVLGRRREVGALDALLGVVERVEVTGR